MIGASPAPDPGRRTRPGRAAGRTPRRRATVLSANPAGRPAQLLPIALACYLDRSRLAARPGIAYLAFLATMPLTGVAGDVCGPHRATDPGDLRAATCQRAIPRHHQREPRMCLGRAHRHRRPPGLPARDDGRHRLAARCQGHPGAGRSMAPHRRGPSRPSGPTGCPTPSTTHPAHHRCTSPGSYAAPVMRRSSTSTLTSPGRSRAAPKTSKAPGFHCSPAWSSTLNEARLRPQTRQGETGRRAAASQGPAPAGTRDTPADWPDAPAVLNALTSPGPGE